MDIYDWTSVRISSAKRFEMCTMRFSQTICMASASLWHQGRSDKVVRRQTMQILLWKMTINCLILKLHHMHSFFGVCVCEYSHLWWQGKWRAQMKWPMQINDFIFNIRLNCYFVHCKENEFILCLSFSI